MTLPTKWATDTNFATGPDTGTPTRVTPGAGIAAQGFIPHDGVPAQHVNALLGQIIDSLYEPIEQPETYAEIREDFISAYFDSATGLLTSQVLWFVEPTHEDAAFDADATHPGTVLSSLAIGEEFGMHLQGSHRPVLWGSLQDMTIVAAVTSSNMTGHEMFIGLSETGSDVADVDANDTAVGLWFKRATSANWMVRHMAATVDDATISTEVVATAVYVVMKFHRISTTQVEVTLNGDLIATLTDGVDAPPDNTAIKPVFVAKAGGSASMFPKLDLIYVRWTTPSRQT